MSHVAKPTVRPLLPTDRAQWEGLWREYLDFYQSTMDEAVYAHTFERLSNQEYEPMFGFVAEYQGRLLGLVNCINHDHGWSLEQVTYLQDLYVSAAARNMGLGQALIEAVYAYADQTHKANVYWTTRTSNHTARKLYDRVGVLTDFIKYHR